MKPIKTEVQQNRNDLKTFFCYVSILRSPDYFPLSFTTSSRIPLGVLFYANLVTDWTWRITLLKHQVKHPINLKKKLPTYKNKKCSSI